MAEAKPSWIKTKPEELEKIVVDLAKSGESPAKIGLILRDKHGVPKAKLLGKKINQILKEKGVEFPTELQNAEKKLENLKSHFGKNKHDYPAKRSITKQLWVIRDLQKASP